MNTESGTVDKPLKRPGTPWQLILMRRLLALTSALSPTLAGHWVNLLWYRTHPSQVRPREQQVLDRADLRTLEFEGHSVQCYSWGEGPAVLLVHGWNGRAAQMAPIASALVKQGFRVVAFDAPAHGLSPGRRTELPVISAAIEQIGQVFGPFCASVTHSFGGMSLLHAVHNGFEVERIACIAPPLDVAYLVDQFAGVLQLPDKTVQVQKRLLEKRFGDSIWTRFSMTGWVEQLNIPGLLIHDEQDSFVHPDNSKRIAHSWVHSELVLTRGLGHNKILKSRVVIEHLNAFLAPLAP